MTNVGSETPTREAAITMWASALPRRSAVYTPMGMPTSSARSAAVKESSSVAGSRSRIMLDRTLFPQALPEVTPRRASEEVGVLHVEGLIEPEQMGDPLSILGRGVLPEHEHDRITDEPKEREGNQPDYEHDQHGLEEPADNERGHRRPMERLGPLHATSASAHGIRTGRLTA